MSLRPISTALLWVTVFLTVASSRAATRSSASEVVSDLVWVERGAGKQIRLSEFRGKVVVLDFFAHWCAPCITASKDIELQIRAPYSARPMAPGGTGVEVLAVNVESEAPEATEEFIKQAGLSLVLDDPHGRVFEQLGGQALPFIVVLAEKPKAASDLGWEIVYRRSGYEGAASLRRLIDGLLGRSEPTTADPRAAAGPADRVTSSAAIRQTIDASTDLLTSSDTRLFGSQIAFRETRPDWDWQFSLGHQRYEVEYEPDFQIPGLFESRALHEDQTSVQGGARFDVAAGLKWLINAGYYRGFTDYKSIWLEEYYRQSFAALSGYRESDPAGYSVSTGFRWEYLPGAGILQADGGYQYDTVSPSYDKPILRPLIRGLDQVNTWFSRISLENVISRRVRLLNEARLVASTERDLRYAYQGQINWAVAEHLTFRTSASGTWELPEFAAYSAEAAAEYDWRNRWFVRTFARKYTDDGLIRDPRIVSSAQPRLDTWMLGGGLRWAGERLSCDLMVSPYITRYGELPRSSLVFKNLYRARDWWSVRLALAYRF